MKCLSETRRELGRAEVVSAAPSPGQIIERAHECLRCRRCDNRTRNVVDVYIGEPIFDLVQKSFLEFARDTFGIMQTSVGMEGLFPHSAVFFDGIELRFIRIPAGNKTTVSIVDLSDVVQGGAVMTPGKHFMWLVESPVESVALLVATHTGKRLRKRGSCEKCGTQTNWVVDASGRVGAYWCGCGN